MILPLCARWEKAEELFKDCETIEEWKELINKHDKEFFLPVKSSKKGVNITAIDANVTQLIDLRYFENKVDFVISIKDPLFSDAASIYIQILDEDKFLIRELFISNVCEEFSGELYGKLNISFEDFLKIKYYHLIGRDKKIGI
jgi:hypothetical protein